MCGIAGIVMHGADAGPRGTAATIARAMAGTLVHRGPDDSGVWESDDGTVALAHRRLSIIDLSPLGRNPMSLSGRALWITFNGEIYNFLELRAELEQAGYRFRSHSDTEVILAAYDRWDLACVDRLVGMFAFALWDERRRRLWVVRDRLGKKPLYYSTARGRFAFGSELKALIASGGIAPDIDPAALALYLRFGYVPAPHTIFSSASKLPPGHHLVWEHDHAAVTRYWDPVHYASATTARSEAAAEEELESLLGTAVRQRRIADVPLGAFLSGGIDSSLVVALMQEQASEPIRTFTIRFDNPEYNEADHAAAVARHLGTEHHEQRCGEDELLAIVDRLPEMFDEPFADSSAIPTHLVSRMARERVTVALSGDGGDELFFGYPRYSHHADRAWVLDLPRPVRRAVAYPASRLPTRRLRRIADVLRSDDRDHYARFASWWLPQEVQTLTGNLSPESPIYADVLARSTGADRRDRPGLLDLTTYLPDDILAKVDRASMAVNLEVRAPLLDHRVVEFALGLPHRMKHRGKATKWILRQLLYRRVPRTLLDRPKMGFSVPLDDWFRGPLRERMNAYCAGDDLEELGLNPQPVRRLWTEYQAGQSHRSDLLWQMFMLVAWSRRFRAVHVPVLP